MAIINGCTYAGSAFEKVRDNGGEWRLSEGAVKGSRKSEFRRHGAAYPAYIEPLAYFAITPVVPVRPHVLIDLIFANTKSLCRLSIIDKPFAALRRVYFDSFSFRSG